MYKGDAKMVTGQAGRQAGRQGARVCLTALKIFTDA